MQNLFSLKKDFYPLLKLTLPLALMGLVQSSVWFFETLFLARLGTHTLAAGSLVSWFFGTLAVILFGLLSSINVLIAHKHGANDQEGIARVARDGILLALLITIPAFLLFWFMSPIFLLFGQSQTIVMLAQSYLHAMAWGLPANFVMVACLEVIIGIGHVRVVLFFSTFWVVLNILFSYAFIFGNWGLPAFGIAGAGWGMTASDYIIVLCIIFYLLISKNYRVYFRYIFKWDKPFFLFELTKVGLPMGIMYCVEVGFFFALTLFMGLFGSTMQAANQVALQYMGILMSIMFSIAQAVTVRMGHLIGAGDYYAAERATFVGVSLPTLITMSAAILYWFFPDVLITLVFDTHNPQNLNVVNDIKKLFVVSALFQIIEAIRIVFFGSLRGLKDTRFTLIASILSFWVIALPIGYLFAMYFRLQGVGFWWGMVFGATFSVILLYRRFKMKINQFHIVKMVVPSSI